MSISDTTSTPTSGCKYSIWIPFLMASVFILFILAMGHESPKYSLPAHLFDGENGKFYRLEGRFVPHHEPENKPELCSESVCLCIDLVSHTQLKPDSEIIVEGIWKDSCFVASRVLTKCH